MREETLDIAFKVMVPLSGVLILSVLIFVVIYRHFRCCRKRKRGKNSAVVKASEGIHLLDKINVVNKNPTYFVSNASGQLVKTDVTDIPAKDIRLLEVVGEGAFGQVYRGMDIFNTHWFLCNTPKNHIAMQKFYLQELRKLTTDYNLESMYLTKRFEEL